MEEENQIEVCKPSDKDFLRSLENAVRFGKPVVMENVLEALDPALEPVLLKQVFKQGGSDVIKIGDNVIPYHQDFRFFMTSKLPNPHYTPETSVKVTLLNFTITQEGLEDQLLGITVAKERPDLEDTKNNLVASNARMAAQLKDIESQILKLLSESQGNILDDENLIHTLAQSKVTSNEIEIKAAEAAETEVVIDKTREEYRPVAFHAALLFFCVADMVTASHKPNWMLCATLAQPCSRISMMSMTVLMTLMRTLYADDDNDVVNDVDNDDEDDDEDDGGGGGSAEEVLLLLLLVMVVVERWMMEVVVLVRTTITMAELVVVVEVVVVLVMMIM